MFMGCKEFRLPRILVESGDIEGMKDCLYRYLQAQYLAEHKEDFLEWAISKVILMMTTDALIKKA